MAFEFLESTLSQTNGEINYMVCWSGSLIVPASWSSMVVFDGIFAREASGAATDKLHETCTGDNGNEHSVIDHYGTQ